MSSLVKYENVSTRAGFNTVVRHIKASISYVEAVASKTNLSDVFFDAPESDGLNGDRLAAILRMNLVDRFGYRTLSRNLRSVSDNLSELAAEVQKWNAVDIVLVYHHPDLGLLTANPKDSDQLAAFGALKKPEPIVAYVGRFDKPSDDLCATAAELIISLLEGIKVAIPQSLYKGDCVFKKTETKKAEIQAAKAAIKAKKSATKTAKAKKSTALPIQTVKALAQPAAAPVPVPAGPSPRARMTPMYSVVVQNELFHNGNVEAWKRIIESYKTKHPNLEVYIYYDNERILNINSLFKWGKVKHGSTIQFAVAGADIMDVAKLQRYLNQGASHMFESFLHGPVSTVLKLF